MADWTRDGDVPLTQRALGQKPQMASVTLSLDTSAYSAADVLAATQEVTSFFSLQNGKAILDSIFILDEDDQGAAFDIYFMDANVALGSENSAPNISDTDARSIIARVAVATGDYADIGGCKVAQLSGLNRELKSVASSTSIYIGAVNGAGTPTYTAAGLKLRIGYRE